MINVLSLFDGCSMARVAMDRAGIKITNYYASEIDKYAIKVSQKNYPDIIRLGDVRNWKDWSLPPIDFLIGGFPCQNYSIAGKRTGIKGDSGFLINYVFEILKHYKPKNFLLENVPGILSINKGETFKYILNELNSCGYEVNWIAINSALVSAQNRKRIYLTNLKGINQPEDKHIYLKDILEHGVTDRDKSYCIDANYFKGGNLQQYFNKSRRQLVFDAPERVCSYGKGGQGQRVYNINGKSTALSALGGGRGAKTGLYAIAQRGLNLIDGKRIDVLGAKTYVLEVGEEKYTVRKLTPLECERLQTLPDDYTNGASNCQRYKMLGNGFTVDVIAHIIKENE